VAAFMKASGSTISAPVAKFPWPGIICLPDRLHHLDGGLPLSNAILRSLDNVISFKYPNACVPSLAR
jgi:hypothetical protein